MALSVETTQLGAAPTRRTGSETESAFECYMGIYPDIDGWFGVESAAIWDALLSFQRRANVRGHLLEIGVHHGKSAALMAMHAERGFESCVFVDKFLAEAEVRNALTRAGRTVDESIQLVRMDSMKLPVSPLLSTGYREFRWVHIDGEHTARAVMSDLAVAHSLLGDWGIVSVDDFFSWLYPQITEAVLRYVRENPDRFQLFLCGHNKAYLARPQFIRELLPFCANQLAGELEQRGVQAMLTKTTWPAEMNCFGVVARDGDRTHRGPDWELDAIRF
ncbi:MAG: class I SAM-dependent methyltransferase [Myxococcota bacterium]